MIDTLILILLATIAVATIYKVHSKDPSVRDALLEVIEWPFIFFSKTPKP